ncbi:unnamed protein product [Symbiodinium necroappetens]|uniref:Uncharacterized protein n=1 Tax=Symbiodinium necroappetens TaxID=1628268 RepID=A0A812PKT2_9DINO|nr:unnamed protein product [Symbiodinium necroappetens]
MAVARGRTARAALLLALVVPATLCFTGAFAPAVESRAARQAEAAAASSSGSSVALVKEDSDVASVLKGVSSASLEAVNFVDYINSKYDVTSKVGTALNDALDKSDGETSSSVKSSLDSVGDAITSFDKDVGIKDTLGSLILSGTDLASQLATKAPRACRVLPFEGS